MQIMLLQMLLQRVIVNIVTGWKKREVLNRDEKYRYFTPGEKDQLDQKNIAKKIL